MAAGPAIGPVKPMVELKTLENQEFISHLDGLSQGLNQTQTSGWIKELRAKGMSRFRGLGLPSVKDEEWKLTNISALTEYRYALAPGPHFAEHAALADYLGEDGFSVVFVNGLFSKELSRLTRVPDGVTISDEDAAQDLFSQTARPDESGFAALNTALMQNAACIRVADNAVVKTTLHIVHITSGAGPHWVVAPRTLISLGRHAEASILESHLAFADEALYFCDARTDIVLDENASLRYCKAQKEGLKAFHIGTTYVRQAADSDFHGFSLVAGAALTRNNLEVIVDGEGANTVLNGLYSVYKEQHVDNHTSVDHRVPHGTSNQLYKGILNDSARAVFNGKIFVRTIAQGTNSYQLNKNLLLGKGCRVDTKPQLEIFADDVKCSHGATIGQLNPEEIFYLQSRCIPPKAAAKLLTRGFADEILNTIPEKDIRQKLTMLLEPTLEVLA